VFGGPPPSPDGYEVYRSDVGSPAAAQLLGTTSTSSYEDKAFNFGSRYSYTVRAFTRRGDSTARTPESNRVEIAATDKFPPAAPQELSAIAVPGAVELSWSPNAEADLAGYNIYRAESDGFTRVNSELITVPLYRDTTAQAGTQHRYHITAVDRSGNEGLPSADATVTAE
jgi:fibronectin type 3 domain-containing protein